MRLLLVGDVMLGRLVNKSLKNLPPFYPWSDTLPIFESADCRICNLECAISNRGTKWHETPKIFHFRTDEKNVATLQAAKINMVSLANNHVIDFGLDALIDTLNILDRVEVAHAGAGLTYDAAIRPAIVSVGDFRIAMIAFSDNQPEWAAKNKCPGIFYVPIEHAAESKVLLQAIRNTRPHCDLLIASAHWGPNWGYSPPPSHVCLSRDLIEAGADVVYGHSAHVFRGIEIYHQKPVFYSTGDFIDDYAVDPDERNDLSFIFLLDILKAHQISLVQLFPTTIGDFQARVASGNDASEAFEKMCSLCDKLGTTVNWDPLGKRLSITPQSSRTENEFP